MKNFNFPKTKFEDYVNYREMIMVNLKHFKKIEMSEEKIRENINFMYDRFFKNKIYENDLYSFDSLNNLEDFLFSTGIFSTNLIEDCINHEKEHLHKINEFNYKVRGFFVWLLQYEKGITFSAGISLDGKDIPYEKLKEIYAAPENLSLTDEFFL
jgi:hypothetical protein